MVSGLACRDARSVLCRPHPSLARSSASRLLPHPPPVCWYCCIKLPLPALPLPDPLRGSASCASSHPPPVCWRCCAVSKLLPLLRLLQGAGPASIPVGFFFKKITDRGLAFCSQAKGSQSPALKPARASDVPWALNVES